MDNSNDVGPIAVDYKAMDRTYGQFFHDIGVKSWCKVRRIRKQR